MDIRISLHRLKPGDLPLHRQAELALRKLVEAPEYAEEGRLLPDEVTLADRLGVSRGTIRSAIGRLVDEGRLERKSGVGTRVLQQPTESAIGAWRSLSREMARSGISVELFRCELVVQPASDAVATALRVRQGTRLQRLDRVRGWGGLPVLRSRSWLHPRIEFDQDTVFDKPLYDMIADRSGLIAAHARETFSAVAASAELSTDLKVAEGSPLLMREHIVRDETQLPIEFAEVHYVSDRFKLSLELRRDQP